MTITQNQRTLLLNFAALVLILFLVWKASNIIFYILISSGMAVIGNNLANKMESIKWKKRCIPRWLSSILIIIFFYSLIFIGLRILVPMIFSQATSLAEIDPEKVIQSIEEPVNSIIHKFSIKENNEPLHLTELFHEKFTSILNLSNVTSWVNSITSIAGDVLFAMFSITFITFFLIKDGKEIYSKIMSLLSKQNQVKVESIIDRSLIQLNRYFVGLLIETIAVFLLGSLGLWIMGVDEFLLIAFIAAILNVIPYIGPLLAMAIGVVIVLASNYQLPFTTELLPLIYTTLITMIIVHFIDSMILQPLIYSSSVNAHPLEIFLVILVAGNIGGITAMIFAIPSYSILRIIISEVWKKPNNSLTENITENN